MTGRVMSISMISDKQAIALGVVVLVALWYAKTKAAGLGGKLSEIIFGPELEPPIKMSVSARAREDEYIRMGYAYRDKNGAFKITPLGEMYISRMAKQNRRQ